MGWSDFAPAKTVDREDTSPGPGAYYSDTPVVGAGPTMKGRNFMPIVGGLSEAVGPGKYDIPNTIGTAPKFSFGRSHKSGEDVTETKLGPAYSPRQYEMSANPASPRFTLGGRCAVSGAVTASFSPGPQYSLPSTFDSTAGSGGNKKPKGPVMLFRHEPKFEAEVTPAAYPIKRFGDEVAAPKVVHNHHTFPVPPPPQPGPGEYVSNIGNIEQTTTPRVNPKNGKLIPTFIGRHFPPIAEAKGVPGPGQYDPVPPPGRSVKIQPPTETAKELEDVYPQPAPGQYEVNTSSVTGKGFTLGVRQPELSDKMRVPGPQKYTVPQYSMTEALKKSRQGMRFNGSKGDFDPVSKVSPRGEKIVVFGPGPAAHDAKLPTTRVGAVMTKADRFPTSSADNAPAPGTYSLKSTMSQSKGTSFIRGFYERPPKDATPGPGAYNDDEAFKKTRLAARTTGMKGPVPPVKPKAQTPRK